MSILANKKNTNHNNHNNKNVTVKNEHINNDLLSRFSNNVDNSFIKKFTKSSDSASSLRIGNFTNEFTERKQMLSNYNKNNQYDDESDCDEEELKETHSNNRHSDESQSTLHQTINSNDETHLTSLDEHNEAMCSKGRNEASKTGHQLADEKCTTCDDEDMNEEINLINQGCSNKKNHSPSFSDQINNPKRLKKYSHLMTQDCFNKTLDSEKEYSLLKMPKSNSSRSSCSSNASISSGIGSSNGNKDSTNSTNKPSNKTNDTNSSDLFGNELNTETNDLKITKAINHLNSSTKINVGKNVTKSSDYLMNNDDENLVVERNESDYDDEDTNEYFNFNYDSLDEEEAIKFDEAKQPSEKSISKLKSKHQQQYLAKKRKSMAINKNLSSVQNNLSENIANNLLRTMNEILTSQLMLTRKVDSIKQSFSAVHRRLKDIELNFKNNRRRIKFLQSRKHVIKPKPLSYEVMPLVIKEEQISEAAEPIIIVESSKPVEEAKTHKESTPEVMMNLKFKRPDYVVDSPLKEPVTFQSVSLYVEPPQESSAETKLTNDLNEKTSNLTSFSPNGFGQQQQHHALSISNLTENLNKYQQSINYIHQQKQFYNHYQAAAANKQHSNFNNSNNNNTNNKSHSSVSKSLSEPMNENQNLISSKSNKMMSDLLLKQAAAAAGNYQNAKSFSNQMALIKTQSSQFSNGLANGNANFNNNNNQINKNCSNAKSNNNTTSNTQANPMFHPFTHGKLQAQNSGPNLNTGIQFHHQNNSAFQHSPQHSLIQSHLQHNNFHHPFHQGLMSSLSSPILPAGPINKNQIINNNNSTPNAGNSAAAGLRNGLLASSIVQTAPPGSITRSITPSSSSSQSNNFSMALTENIRNHMHHHEFQSANLETIKEDQNNNHNSNVNDEADYDSGDEEPDSPYLQSNQRDTMEQAANFIAHQQGLIRHVPSGSVDQLELDEEAEILVSKDVIKRCIRKAKHRGNFAANLAAELFTKEERISCNCTGTRGKRQLSPRRLHLVKDITFRMYHTNPAVLAATTSTNASTAAVATAAVNVAYHEFEEAWRKECITAIDAKNRSIGRDLIKTSFTSSKENSTNNTLSPGATSTPYSNSESNNQLETNEN